MDNPKKPKNNIKLVLFVLIAILSIALSYWKLGFSISFWIIIIVWILLYLLSLLRQLSKITYYLWIAMLVALSFSVLVSFRIIIIDKNIQTASDSASISADGFILTDCTSTINDSPVALSGWKSTIYTGALTKELSLDVSDAKEVRTFSFKGITDKSEANSLYSRVERDDHTFLTGFGTAMEACSADNKTTKSYSIAENTYIDGEKVLASTHYLHGGAFLHGPGDYRIDVYVKTLDGIWHLIDRLTGIKVTE